VHLPALLSDHATHFEQVGEIGREPDCEPQVPGLKIKIADAKPFEAAPFP
jgi:hypothetical protein